MHSLHLVHIERSTNAGMWKRYQTQKKMPQVFLFESISFTPSILSHLKGPRKAHHSACTIVNTTPQTQSLTLIIVRSEPSPLWLETEAIMLKKRDQYPLVNFHSCSNQELSFAVNQACYYIHIKSILSPNLIL